MIKPEEFFFVKSFINDNIFYFTKTLTIFQACLEKNFYVPRFCFHSKLSIAGNCRMCLLEEKKISKPVVSCAMNLANGMQVYTRTKLVKSARESVIEFLLINHPLDCPICDQGGECDLQDETMVFGADRGRFYENKRAVKNKNFGPFIKLFLNRCIHCARCTRFFDEYVERRSLALLGRGQQTEIGLYIEKFLLSEVSGNIIDLCPVGAITAKPASYVGRDWEYFSVNSVDIFDAVNSTLRIDFRGNEILRVLPSSNRFINEDWITDKARFFYDAIFSQRLSRPLLRSDKILIEVGWLQVFFFIKNYFFRTIEFSAQRKKLYLPNHFYLGDIEGAKNLLYIDYFVSYYNTFFLQNNILGGGLAAVSRNDYFLTTANWWNMLEEGAVKDLYLISLNLRFEAPIILLRLKKSVNFKNIRVSTFGFLSNMGLGFVSYFFGNSIHNFQDKLISNHNKFIMGLMGLMASEVLHQLVAVYGNKRRLNIRLLCSTTTCINLMELSFNNKNTYMRKNFFNKILLDCSLLYNINFDNFMDWTWEGNLKRALLIYQGTHADYSIKFYNVVLPTLTFVEHKTLFINNFARIQEPEYINFKHKYNLAREGKDILNGLLELLSAKNTFLPGGGLWRQYIFRGIFYLYGTNNLFGLCSPIKYSSNYFFYPSYFFCSLINNYYGGNSILRNSAVLSAGSQLTLTINDFKFCCIDRD